MSVSTGSASVSRGRVSPLLRPTPKQFGAEVAWPEDWPEAQVGMEPAGSPGEADESHMDEDMTDLLDFLGGSGAT